MAASTEESERGVGGLTKQHFSARHRHYLDYFHKLLRVLCAVSLKGWGRNDVLARLYAWPRHPNPTITPEAISTSSQLLEQPLCANPGPTSSFQHLGQISCSFITPFSNKVPRGGGHTLREEGRNSSLMGSMTPHLSNTSQGVWRLQTT